MVKKIILTILLFLNTTILSQAKTIDTTIKADFINIKRNNETVTFTNNVTVEREDFSMKSDNAIVYYQENNEPSAENSNTSIQRIEASDNVRIFNDEFVATGNYGIYNPGQNNVILKENVIFNNGTSVAKGEKFIYDLKTKKGNLVGQDLTQEKKAAENEGKSSDNRVILIINENDDLQEKDQKIDNE